MGIATALNAGLEFARERGYRWLATFDQDSRATPSMIDDMFRALATYSQADRVAVVSPVHYDCQLQMGIRQPLFDVAGPGWRVILAAMTSGNLIDIQAADAVGGFDESLFIDSSTTIFA